MFQEVRGEICGGFSDIPWDKTNSKAQYIAIEKKFPFHQILTNQDLSPIKFDIMKKFYLLSAIQSKNHRDFSEDHRYRILKVNLI